MKCGHNLDAEQVSIHIFTTSAVTDQVQIAIRLAERACLNPLGFKEIGFGSQAMDTALA